MAVYSPYSGAYSPTYGAGGAQTGSFALPSGQPPPTQQYFPSGLSGMLPNLPNISDPYAQQAAMAYSNMMSDRASAYGGLHQQIASIRNSSYGGGTGADPSIAAWMGPNVVNYQKGNEDFPSILHADQAYVDALAGQGGPHGMQAAQIADARNAAGYAAYQGYQHYTDQVQQYAMQQALAQQQGRTDFEGKVTDALLQQAQNGISAGQSRMALDALLAGSGAAYGPQAKTDLYGAFNAAYPGGTTGAGGRISPLGSITLLDSAANPGAAVVYGAVLNEMKDVQDPNAVMQNILTKAQSDPALATALAKPGTLQAVTQYAFSQQHQAGGGPQQAATLAPAKVTGDITIGDRLENAAKDAAFAGAATSFLGPWVAGPAAALGGLWGAFTAHDTPGDWNPLKIAEDVGVKGLGYGMLGRLGLGGGLPAKLGGSFLAGQGERMLAGAAEAGGLKSILPWLGGKVAAGLGSTPTAGRLMFSGMPVGQTVQRAAGGLEKLFGRGEAEAAAARSGVPFAGEAGVGVQPPNAGGGTPFGVPAATMESLRAGPAGIGVQPPNAGGGAPFGVGPEPFTPPEGAIPYAGGPGVGVQPPNAGGGWGFQPEGAAQAGPGPLDYLGTRYAGPAEPYYPYAQNLRQPYGGPLMAGPEGPSGALLNPNVVEGPYGPFTGGGLQGAATQAATSGLSQAQMLAPLRDTMMAIDPATWQLIEANALPAERLQEFVNVIQQALGGG